MTSDVKRSRLKNCILSSDWARERALGQHSFFGKVK